jgi:hypothetical protein
VGKHDGFVNAALSIIRANGGKGVLVRRVDGTFNPVTQLEANGDETRVEFDAVVFPPGKTAEKRIGSLIGKNIVEIYFAQKDKPVPVPTDRFEWAGKVYTIIWTETYDPAGDGPILTVAHGEI